MIQQFLNLFALGQNKSVLLENKSNFFLEKKEEKN